MKTIKLIGTKNYEVSLIETDNGKYRVLNTTLGETRDSGDIVDYKLASALFDMKLQELDGN